MAKTWQEQQEHHSKGDICYLENICGVAQPYKRALSKVNLTFFGGKHVLALFLN